MAREIADREAAYTAEYEAELSRMKAERFAAEDTA